MGCAPLPELRFYRQQSQHERRGAAMMKKWFVCPNCRQIEVTSFQTEQVVHRHHPGGRISEPQFYNLTACRDIDEAMDYAQYRKDMRP